MTRKCCVPGCKSNNKIGEPYVSTFSFPKDEAARKVWLSKIGRDDLTITQSVGVCGKHFLEEEILRETSAYDDLKKVILTCPLKTPRIREGAFPSIFPAPRPTDVIAMERTPRKAKKKAVKRIKEEADSATEELIDETAAKDMLLGALNLDATANLTQEGDVSNEPKDKDEVSHTEVKQATIDQVKRLRVNEPLNSSKPVANSDDPDYCFFTSLCSDFKTIQNPKTRAFLKMEFQRMVFNAKYEK
ncbi:hypothetical protein GE061_005809 [Apolygus lucorum]|uniref:THAP-type domain-containing protein n=1 Tax=Apolygus lucorum TaxID=248454 RepID=A0A8S9WZ35_APOLU|nr:hypothetical protein GE061_005809 [Apolygus lucorum]